MMMMTINGPRVGDRLGTGFFLIVGVLAAVVITAGCTRGPRNFENENDKLRRANLELRREVDKLQQAVDARLAEIDKLEQQQGRTPPVIEGAELPRLIAIRFDRYSGVLDTDGDGADDTVRIYLKTLDQQGRFIPAAGEAVIQLVMIEPGAAPVVLGERAFDASQFDTAYRSGLTGTHYRLELPLPEPTPAEVNQATVKVTFTDAADGARLSYEMPVPLTSRGP